MEKSQLWALALTKGLSTLDATSTMTLPEEFSTRDGGASTLALSGSSKT